MDDFVRCPQCDDDVEGSQWESHLKSHGWVREATPEITEAMVDLRLRYDAYAEAVVEDAVGDTTGTLERRDEALNCLVESIGAALRAALADKGVGDG